ncbi:aspartyl protease [Nostoc sp. LPT]|uniref:aspartyl protease n=1 Tax=Nostoc sp. LPT TaxID=2815387 RepID=UPI001D6D55CA|nr:aspartyl protease [Nostoc sp. LPT]MBN4002960.1 aspartyl protease [Nostoc sp. LPT]
MIEGKFGDSGQLFFEIDLITSDGLNLPVDAMLDTGFTGFLANMIQGKFWEKGQLFFEIELITDEITEVFLGSEWLKILPLMVNYQAGILSFG